MNSFFSSIGEKRVTQTRINPIEMLKAMPDQGNSCYFYDVTKNELINTNNEIKSKKCEDIYGISTKILKEIKQEVAAPLALLINKSFGTAVLPKELKVA